ncbi:MAG: nitroreductase [Flavobacteriales bacterium]|nr:nitroreductase [Flavobacteriales bacterium]MCB9447501.1 nitroreductase [Flavobacteriales bacterium]
MKFNLSEISSLIRERRTIKPESFSSRKVHREIVEKLLDVARWAPTHGMTQPWRFIVFEGDGVKRLSGVQAQTYERLNEGSRFVKAKWEQLRDRPLRATVVIAICMQRQPEEKIPEIEEVEAVACAVQNIMLMATAYGIGSYWSSGGLTYTEEMKAFLELGERDRCLGFLYLGYPNEAWPESQRRPVDTFTKWISEG